MFQITLENEQELQNFSAIVNNGVKSSNDSIASGAIAYKVFRTTQEVKISNEAENKEKVKTDSLKNKDNKITEITSKSSKKKKKKKKNRK